MSSTSTYKQPTQLKIEQERFRDDARIKLNPAEANDEKMIIQS